MRKTFAEYIDADQVEKIPEKEIDSFIDNFWLTWTCKFDLSPCGHLTVHGKREYIKNNIDEVKALIKFERENRGLK